MSNPQTDLLKAFEELQAKFNEVRDQVEAYKREAQEAEKIAKAAEQSAKSAQQLASEADDKYKKALELKGGQYEQLIHDLFEAPQKELVRQMETHSRRSHFTTMLTAVGSIVITLLLSMYFQIQSSHSSQNLIRGMEENQRAVNGLLTKVDSVNENIWATDNNIKKIVQLIDDGRKDFRNYQSKNDVALFFKVRMSNSTSDVRYGDYLKAFKVSKVNDQFIPTVEELKRWDMEYIELCKTAIKQLETKVNIPKLPYRLIYNPITKMYDFKESISTPNANNSNSNMVATVKNDEEKRFRTYKAESDLTDYEAWGWNGDLTYSSLLGNFRRELEAVEKRIKINT